MGHPLTPVEVDREGIRGITREMIAEAEAAGERWKLVCKAYWQEEISLPGVRPERVGRVRRSIAWAGPLLRQL